MNHKYIHQCLIQRGRGGEGERCLDISSAVKSKSSLFPGGGSKFALTYMRGGEGNNIMKVRFLHNINDNTINRL